MSNGISYLVRIAISLICTLLLLGSCNYRQDLDELTKEVERLQTLVDQINENTENLSQLIATFLQSNDWVTSIEPVYEGDVVTGTMIYFLHREPIFISNGKKGPKGDDGADGKNGSDAQAPSISLMQDEDGLWYWTLNGQWLLDDKGEKVMARGADGAVPLIKAESHKWWVSYDSGKSWIAVGDLVEYDHTWPNYSSVEIVDGSTCVVTLNNGQKIYLPLFVDFDVDFPYGNQYYLDSGKGLSVTAIVSPYVETDISSVCDSGISVTGIERSSDYPGIVRINFLASGSFSGGSVKIVFEKCGKLILKQLAFRGMDPGDESVKEVVLSENSLNLALECTHRLYAHVLPLNPNYGNIIWSSDNPEVVSVNSRGLVKAVSSGNCTVTAMAHNGKYATCYVTVGSRKAIDLGLSVNWAECNVGATTAFETGAYFAWGETENKSSEGPQSYDWNTYRLCEGTSTTLTRYNTKTSFGKVDKLTVLLDGDDAASSQWGDIWRMPTAQEWAELYDYCTWEWLEKDQGSSKVSGFTAGSAGFLVIKGGVGLKTLDPECYIFLPSCGFFCGNYIEDTGKCHYWSSSLYVDHPDCAMEFMAGPSAFKPQYGTFRCYGMSVRAVIP